MQELFDFVTDVSLVDHEAFIEKKKIELEARTDSFYETARQNEAIFKDSFIPRILDDVIDIERDVEKIKSGVTTDILYQKIIGIGNTHSSDSEDSSSESEESESDSEQSVPLTEEEKKAQRKENKKKVKEEKKEKRKTKISKYEKKKKLQSNKKK